MTGVFMLFIVEIYNKTKIVCDNENEKYCYFIVEMNLNIFKLK